MIPETQDFTEEFPVHRNFDMSKMPYSAVSVPFDLKHQYTDAKINQIVEVAHYKDTSQDVDVLDSKLRAVCEIVFLDGEDEWTEIWETELSPDNNWMRWKGWKLVKVSRL